MPDLGSSSARARRDASLDGDPDQCEARQQEGRRSHHEDHFDVGECDEHARSERADQGAEALDRRGRSVRGDQLARRPGQRRQQRHERGPEQRRAHTDHGPGDEDDASLVQESPGRGDAETCRTHQREAEEEALAAEPIAERRGKRRDRGRRQQAHQAGDADGCRATVVVGEDAEGDEVRPLGRYQRAPGQLGAPNVRVASRDVKRAECLARAGCEEAQRDADTRRGVGVSSPRFTIRR